MTPEDKKAYNRAYHTANREKLLKQMRLRYRKNRTDRLRYARLRRRRFLSEFKAREKQQNQNRRRLTIEAYGGRCACCGLDDWRFLTVDHTNGGGKAHRKRERLSNGQSTYLWLKDRGYPRDGFQVLCMNCNSAKQWFGACPHQENALGSVSLTIAPVGQRVVG